jgi:methylmalonyl-CoA/ethylmalonyl-CoA epimerase
MLNTHYSKMQHIEHIGIAVKSLESSNDLFTKLLGLAPYKQEVVESEGVTTSFYQTGQTKIELLEANSPESPIAKFIK